MAHSDTEQLPEGLEADSHGANTFLDILDSDVTSDTEKEVAASRLGKHCKKAAWALSQ